MVFACGKKVLSLEGMVDRIFVINSIVLFHFLKPRVCISLTLELINSKIIINNSAFGNWTASHLIPQFSATEMFSLTQKDDIHV